MENSEMTYEESIEAFRAWATREAGPGVEVTQNSLYVPGWGSLYTDTKPVKWIPVHGLHSTAQWGPINGPTLFGGEAIRAAAAAIRAVGAEQRAKDRKDRKVILAIQEEIGRS